MIREYEHSTVVNTYGTVYTGTRYVAAMSSNSDYSNKAGCESHDVIKISNKAGTLETNKASSASKTF